MIAADGEVDEVTGALRATGSPAPERLFRFVRHEQAAAYERAGWLNTGPLPGHHAEWSVGMEWLCACTPREPDGVR